MMQAPETQPTYEETLRGLEERVKRLEQGDLSLEEALAAVEEGRRFLKRCNELLNEAERRITISPEESGETVASLPGEPVAELLEQDEGPPQDYEPDPDEIPF